MSKLLEANNYMNIGLNSDRSTAIQFVPILYDVILERCGLEVAKEVEEYFLPEQAYDKNHFGFDKVVTECLIKRQQFELENATIKK